MPPPFKEIITVFLCGVFLVENYLRSRQYKKYLIKEIPHQLSDVLTQEKFDKAQEYGKVSSEFSFISGIINFIHNMLLLHLGALPFLWNYTATTMKNYGYNSNEYEITHAILFTVYASLYSMITGLPFDIYHTFVIEERFGFNKQTWKIYVMDQIKGLFLQAVIGIPVLALILKLIQWGGQNFWIYLWIFVTVFSFVMITLYPTLIAPLFNKYTELPQGELREAIELLASKQQFPLTKLFLVDGSTRSAHSNAYLYGFFNNKRIVLYDTLMQQVDTEGIVAILAHEIGHWKNSHTVYNLFIAEAYYGVFFFVFGQTISNADMYKSFGFDTQPVFIGLVLFSFLYEPVGHFFSFFMNWLSRTFEYQADEYATRLGYSLIQPLKKIHVENLSRPISDEWYSAYSDSHPTLLERIKAIESIQAKMK